MLTNEKPMSEATGDNYKQQIEHAARYLLFDEQLCAVPSQRLTLKGALLKVGFSQEEVNNNKHRHRVDRAKRRLSSSLHGSLPSLVNIASPGALSAITDTDEFLLTLLYSYFIVKIVISRYLIHTVLT